MTKETIAVLGGTGDQGPGLALRWAKAGYNVIIGSRQAEKAENTADELNALAARCREHLQNRPVMRYMEDVRLLYDYIIRPVEGLLDDEEVEGVIEGRSIESSHDVDIGETGKVTASIAAKVIRIAGEVTGDINGTEKVLIAKSGRVQGNVTAPRVQLEDGALFRGSIDMNPAKAAESKPAPVASAPASAKAAVVEAGTRKEPGLTLKSG